jgi:hypothetical protein
MFFSVPWLLLPEESIAVVPEPSLRCQIATSPEGIVVVVGAMVVDVEVDVVVVVVGPLHP